MNEQMKQKIHDDAKFTEEQEAYEKMYGFTRHEDEMVTCFCGDTTSYEGEGVVTIGLPTYPKVTLCPRCFTVWRNGVEYLFDEFEETGNSLATSAAIEGEIILVNIGSTSILFTLNANTPTRHIRANISGFVLVGRGDFPDISEIVNDMLDMANKLRKVETKQPDPPAPKTYPFTPDYVVEPAESIREYMDYSKIDHNTFARLMVMATTELDLLLAGNTRIDTRIAKKLELATGQCAQYWLNLETNYQKFKRETNNDTN